MIIIIIHATRYTRTVTDLVPACLCDGEVVLDKAHGVGMTAAEDLFCQTLDLVHVFLVVLQLLLKFLHMTTQGIQITKTYGWLNKGRRPGKMASQT